MRDEVWGDVVAGEQGVGSWLQAGNAILDARRRVTVWVCGCVLRPAGKLPVLLPVPRTDTGAPSGSTHPPACRDPPPAQAMGAGGLPILFQHTGAWTVAAWASGAPNAHGARIAQVGMRAREQPTSSPKLQTNPKFKYKARGRSAPTGSAVVSMRPGQHLTCTWACT